MSENLIQRTASAYTYPLLIKNLLQAPVVDNPGQEIVATCAACWLATRETQERLEQDEGLLAEANTALAEAGLKLKNETPIKHMAEVLIEDIGYDAIGQKVKKPLEGIKIAGYVGCQTNRPFGISGESYENPKYLDKLVETLGADYGVVGEGEETAKGIAPKLKDGLTKLTTAIDKPGFYVIIASQKKSFDRGGNQVLAIYAVTNGFVDGAEPERTNEFVAAMVEYLNTRHGGLMDHVRSTGELPDTAALDDDLPPLSAVATAPRPDPVPPVSTDLLAPGTVLGTLSMRFRREPAAGPAPWRRCWRVSRRRCRRFWPAIHARWRSPGHCW